MFRGLRRVALSLTALLAGFGAAQADDHTLMRFPTISGSTIVFEAHGNLWQVSRNGGAAQRLTADTGYDMMPRFSPDGHWIAFTGSYQGNQDVYAIPAGGGAATRLTYHSDVVDRAPERWGPDNMVAGWTPDSKSIVFLSRREAWNSWISKLYTVPLGGGLQTALPFERGGLMSFSPDGKQLAYSRIFTNFRTWKRYNGGLAQKIFIYDFASKKLTGISNWVGTDTAPMWFRNNLYFLSDRDENRRLNIWAYDMGTRQFYEVTHFTNYDVDFPSLGFGPNGAGAIVFQQGGSLWVTDLPSGQTHQLNVTVPDDGTRTGPRFSDASKAIRDQDTAQQTDFALSPNGKRALFSARGDIFTVPAEHGAIRNLTETSNADEDHPSWSPDGKTVAYTTDVNGEQQIATRSAEGGAENIRTHFKNGFLYTPLWSPDGRHLAVPDGAHQLWLIDGANGNAIVIGRDPYNEIHDQAFSPDGRWIAFSITGDNQQRGLWIYSLASNRAQLVSEPMANDSNPAFSPDGKYLYFVSTRHENPALSETEFNVATLKMSGVYVVTLKKGEASPFAPRSDEGAFEAKKDDKSAPWKPGPGAAVQIDFDGLMARAVPLPIPASDIAEIDARDNKLFYAIQPPQMVDGPLPGEKASLHVYDMGGRKDATVVEDIDSYSISYDGQKVLYKKEGDGQNFEIADAKEGGGDDKAKPKALDFAHMQARIVPTEEWAEMFDNAWRLERDLFVNPAMNGVNWQAVHDAYAKLLPLVGSREDLVYLIGEVLGELGNSHTYVGGGDMDDSTKSEPTVLLGADFALDGASGRYRFAKVYAGDNTRDAYRSPLTEPGVDVHAGDYLLAVNGHELKAPADPYSLFVGLDDGPVSLAVSSNASGARRNVSVKPIANELSVREKDWIDHNRALVDKLSGGRIAYIYMSDMEALGMEQFVRQFYPQLNKRALIMDDRYNGGGNIDQIVLERLRRVLVGMSTNREGVAASIPQQLIDGPKVCLLNQFSASDGDIFPFYFKKYGLGPLIGMRSWGGVRGIRGYWPMIDGGYITVPEDALYGKQSEWVIENHGVDPDIQVEDDPGQLAAGHDAQLEAAVDYLMKALTKNPGGWPAPPAHLPAYPPNGQVGPPSL